MPNYRTDSNEYRNKPKMNFEREPVSYWDKDEEEMMEERKFCHMPCPCKAKCPCQIVVKIKVIPCDDHKHWMHM